MRWKREGAKRLPVHEVQGHRISVPGPRSRLEEIVNYSREQVREAYRNLPPDTQDFVQSNSVSAMIKLLLLGSGLTDEQAEGPGDSAILHAMYGLHSLSDAIAEIARLANKRPEELDELQFVLEEQVFARISR